MAASEAVQTSNIESQIESSGDCGKSIKEDTMDQNDTEKKADEECDEPQTRHPLSLQAESEFNKHQKLLIRNMKSPTNEKVEEFLKGYEFEDTIISDLTFEVMVTLKNGDQADEIISKLNQKEFEEQEVTIAKCLNSKLVCVAHLPLDYSEENFRELVSPHGSIERCFLMKTDYTGESKGYGFVEFSEDGSKTTNMCDELDWKEIQNHRLNVDFVEDHLQVFHKLHSRCLLIDNLPTDFTDVSKLREIFSSVVSPVYCQILMQDTESLGYGIVEFRQPKEAELMWQKLQNYKINDTEISLTFCIPGRHAVSIYNRIMWKINDKLTATDKNSLLPDPVFVSPLVTNAPLVKSLTSQYPQLNDNFTKVLQHLHDSYMKQVMSRNCKPGLLGPAPSLPMSPIMNPSMQLGLFVMLAVQTISQTKKACTGLMAAEMNLLSGVESTETQVKPQTTAKPSLLGDPLTAKAGIILQCLSNQLMPQPVMPSNTPKPLMTIGQPELKFPATMDQLLQNIRNININLLINMGQALSAMQNNLSLKETQKQRPPGQSPHSLLGVPPGVMGQKNSLLGFGPNYREMNPDSTAKGLMEYGAEYGTDSMTQNLDSGAKALLGQKPKGLMEMDFGGSGAAGNAGMFQGSFRNGPVSNFTNQRSGNGSTFASNLQFTGQKNPDFNFTAMSSTAKNLDQSGNRRKGSLLGVPSRQNYNDDVWLAAPPFQTYDRKDWDAADVNQAAASESYSTSAVGSWDYNDSGYGQADTSGYDSYGNSGSYGGQYQESTPLGQGEPSDPQARLAQEAREYAQYAEQYYNQMYSGYDQNYNYSTTDYTNTYNQQMQQAIQGNTDNNTYNQPYGNVANTANTSVPSPSKMKNYSSKHPAFGQIYDSTGLFRNPNNVNQGYDSNYSTYNANNSQYNYNFSQGFQATPKTTEETVSGQAPQMTGESTAYTPPSTNAALNTPIGQKRSYSHLLPPPEPSPEGDYVIGQHSQGIGGHYATSYVKRQKLDNKFSDQSF